MLIGETCLIQSVAESKAQDDVRAVTRKGGKEEERGGFALAVPLLVKCTACKLLVTHSRSPLPQGKKE